MTWIALVAAGLFETAFALSLKSANGFTRPVPSLLFLVSAICSFGLLSVALKELPVGTAYAVWTGIGVVGTAVIGMALHGDTASSGRIASLGLILAGVIGLNLFTQTSAH